MREAAVAQLRYCAELLNARCPESVRTELLTAVGSFAEIAELRHRIRARTGGIGDVPQNDRAAVDGSRTRR
ncbi:MAG: hypothetical protein ACRDTE_13750 [Pseudonocardiaceae bacterium]